MLDEFGRFAPVFRDPNGPNLYDKMKVYERNPQKRKKRNPKVKFKGQPVHGSIVSNLNTVVDWKLQEDGTWTGFYIRLDERVEVRLEPFGKTQGSYLVTMTNQADIDEYWEEWGHMRGNSMFEKFASYVGSHEIVIGPAKDFEMGFIDFRLEDREDGGKDIKISNNGESFKADSSMQIKSWVEAVGGFKNTFGSVIPKSALDKMADINNDGKMTIKLQVKIGKIRHNRQKAFAV